MSDPLSRMDTRELRKLMLDLRSHAQMRLRLRSRSIDLADDFVQTAFLRSKTTRNYNSENVEYVIFLKGIIDSVIYHHYRSFGHTQIQFGDDDAITNFSDDAYSAEDELDYLQQESDMIAYIGTRSLICQRIAIWMVKGGVRSPAKISEITNIPVRKVYGHIKHLRSIVQTWRTISNRPDIALSSVRRIESRE